MSNKKYTVLVVEDNDFVRMQICKFLSDDGFVVVEAADGQAAIDIISDDIHMAIVDVRMEPVNGFEFLHKVRGDGIKTPVILVTGDDNPDLLTEASRFGVGAVLKKPVQKERLIKTVSRVLCLGKRPV